MNHPAAIIHSGVRLAGSITVSVYSLNGAHIKISTGTVVGPHVEIAGCIHIGRDK